MGGEILTQIDGLSNAILLAPDGLEIALEEGVDVFLDSDLPAVVHNLQALSDERYYFEKADVLSLRTAVFNLTLLGTKNSDYARKALREVARRLKNVSSEDFRTAVRDLATRRQMFFFKPRSEARRIAKAVLKKSPFLKKK